MSTEVPSWPTALGVSDADRISLLGHDLPTELMGSVGLTELALWMMTLERPTPGQVRMLDTVLVALADHGFTPTVLSARLTLLSAPESLQGALAAGLLGSGSRFLGVTENSGEFLAAAVATAEPMPTNPAGWDELALAALTRCREQGQLVPGLGHHLHKEGDPRTPVIIEVARQTGTYGPHLALFEAIGRVHHQVLGRHLPLNGAGVCGAALADLGVPMAMLRGVAMLARCAGLLGQLAEEMRHPMAYELFHLVDDHTVPLAETSAQPPAPSQD